MKSFASMKTISAATTGLLSLTNQPCLETFSLIRVLSTPQGRHFSTSHSCASRSSSCCPTSRSQVRVNVGGQALVKDSVGHELLKPGLPGTFACTTTQLRFLADSKTVKEKVEKYRQGSFEDIPDPSDLPHFKTKLVENKDPHQGQDGTSLDSIKKHEQYTLPHPIWTEEQLYDVKITHKEPESFVDKMAYGTVRLFRGGFDIFSGFIFGQRNERKWLNRIVFLETVAGVPGMVAAMMRHMRSLRRLQRDQGWIHTLLEEAENERMHLLTALQLKQPSLFFRMSVIGAQGVFVTMFGASYIVSPSFCHRFVGYLEEEAVKTYTKCLKDIDQGPMTHWKTQPAPEIAVKYWKLQPEATMRDVILAIRADEAHHRLVNHSLASLKKDEFNPYKPGQ